MPQTRYTKFLIKVKSSSSLNVGARCKVTDLSRESVILTGEFRTGNECVLNPFNSSVEWSVGDKIMCEISGKVVGSKQVTLTAGGIQVNVTTATEDSIAVDL